MPSFAALLITGAKGRFEKPVDRPGDLTYSLRTRFGATTSERRVGGKGAILRSKMAEAKVYDGTNQ